MARSLLYTVNETAQDVAVNGIINLGSVIRRFGQNIKLNGNSISLYGAGYYKLTVNATISASAAGDITISVLKNGAGVPGASASATAAAEGNLINLSVDVVFRETCCNPLSDVIVTLGGTAASITNIATTTEKL